MDSLLSAAMVHKRLERSTSLLNDLKNHGNRILIFSDKKTFTVVFNKQDDLQQTVFNKQDDRAVTFGNDLSEYRRLSTTMHPTSIIMLRVVASNGEKMPLALLERDYKLTSAVYKEVLEKKVLTWVKITN